ncbi:MAG: endoglucanase [Myxococcales bacterium]|nr:MAG: endoglucanase [Myxococcales bacterium]
MRRELSAWAMALWRLAWNRSLTHVVTACSLLACAACSDGPSETPAPSGAGGTGSQGAVGGAAGAAPGGSAGASAGSSGVGSAGAGGSPGNGGSAGTPTGGASGGITSGAGGSGTGGSPAGGTSGSNGGGAGGSSGGGGAGGSATFNPCPPSGACKILPLGDSITDGLTVAGGYRIHLFELASEAGKTITFLGGSMNGPTMVAGKPFPRAHEGHSGWTISQIDGIVPTPALGDEPHIVLLHLGTNDMYQGASGAEQRLGALIDQIVQTLPSALLAVSTIIPLPGSASNVTTYNAAVPGVVEARAKQGKHVVFVDQFEGFPTSELADGVHPNAAGYARMAETWYAALAKYLP